MILQIGLTWRRFPPMAASKRKLKLGSCTTFLKTTPVSYDGTALLGLAVCDLAMEKISHLHYWSARAPLLRVKQVSMILKKGWPKNLYALVKVTLFTIKTERGTKSKTQVCLKTYTMHEYFHLQVLFGCSLSIYTKKVPFCFEFELLGAQPCWFILHQ